MNKKGKIIIADDEIIDRELYTTFFETYLPDFKVECFENGKQLKDRLEGKIDNVMAILTDNTMPGEWSGIRIIKEYSNKPGFEKIIFSLIYAGEKEIGEQAIKNGADSYHIKPIERWIYFCKDLREEIIKKVNS